MKKLFAVAAVSLAPALAQAAPFFADNFDANTPQLNGVPVGWNVAFGTVDLVGGSFYGSLCQAGGNVCVDLDGSSGDAGVLSHDFALTAGVTYTAFFDLAGNQRGGSDAMTASFGGSSQSFNLGSGAPWTTYSLVFTPTQNGSFSLVFDHAGNDNVGIMLDNVVIQAVPEPESYALLLAGLGLIGSVARRIRVRTG